MNRIATLLVIAALPTHGSALLATEPQPARPNILIILADDKYELRELESSFAREIPNYCENLMHLQIWGNCGQLRSIQVN
jgi:hypothetical protein